MPNPSVMASADDLFQRWKEFLDSGVLATADPMANGDPNLARPLPPHNAFMAEQAFLSEQTQIVNAPREPDPLPELPGLTVLEKIGSGGMGVVYRVRDALDREWALKLARADQLSPSGRERFLDEARVMARLDHPNVARVHSWGDHGGRIYFTMAIYSANLADRLAVYQADRQKAVRMMMAVAEGMGHLHSRGFVHRDLKPHNVLLDARGEPAVSDFGLVKSLTDTGSCSHPPLAVGSGTGETRPDLIRNTRTVAGVAMGTRRYMAPEQAAGLTHLANPRWDVWAFGVILHELMTGQFPRSSWTPERMLNATEPDNPAPTTIVSDLDPRIESIIQKCLARDERDRYANGREIAEDLRALIELPPPPRSRKPLLVGGLMLAAAVIIAMAIAPWRKPGAVVVDPEQPRFEELRTHTARGETVNLFSESGMPVYGYRQIGGPADVKPRPLADGLLQVDSIPQKYVMLADDPGIESYWFEVELLQLISNPTSRVGVFIGWHDVPTEWGTSHCFGGMVMNNIHGGLNLAYYRFLPENPPARKHSVLSSTNFFPGYLPKEEKPFGIWHKFVVDVEPTGFTWILNGRVRESMPRPMAPPHGPLFVDELVQAIGGARVDVAPRGGIGIAVMNSSAQFRNAKVIPKPKS